MREKGLCPMLGLRLRKGSVCLLVCLLASEGWADEYVNFLAKQQVGRDITVTGGFRRSPDKNHFFRRDDKTGEVENFDFFGLALTPTTLIGNGTLSLRANAMNFLL